MSREDGLEFDVAASLADIKRCVLKTMVNESALGVYVIAWKTESTTVRVIWADGLDGPEFTTTTREGGSAARPIRHLDRLGWQPPRNFAAFKAFVLKFMAAGLEAEDQIDERIRAKEGELEQARAALVANFDRHAGTARMRGKQHKIRGDAQLRRGAQHSETVQRLERELAALKRGADRPAPQPLDLSRLPYARLIRTKTCWYEVVKVNKVSVKVKVDPGWNDRIPISRIIEIREHDKGAS